MGVYLSSVTYPLLPYRDQKKPKPKHSRAITKFTASPTEVLFNLTVRKLLCSLLRDLFLELQNKMSKYHCPLFTDSHEQASL